MHNVMSAFNFLKGITIWGGGKARIFSRVKLFVKKTNTNFSKEVTLWKVEHTLDIGKAVNPI